MRQGYELFRALDGQEELPPGGNFQLDLVIVDIPLASRDSRPTPDHPLAQEIPGARFIVLTVQEGAEEAGQGLDACGPEDGQISLPRLEEVTMQERGLPRRTAVPAPWEPSAAYSDDYLTVNLADRRVIVQGKEVRLTQRECRLLALLVKNAGRVLTYEQLLAEVWGREHLSHSDYVRIYIWRLRQKIEKDPRRPRYILTEHGVGYRFEKAC
jgi:two-component system KDP operon response regulator KdpE